MILHMLRWVLGEEKYNKTMREFAAKYAGKSATMDDFRAIAEKILRRTTHLVLLPVARFHRRSRIQGQVHDLPPGQQQRASAWPARSPRISICSACRWICESTPTAKRKTRSIEVVGTNSPFTVETFGRPRRIAIDPDHHVLTNSSDMKLRSSILRGRACSSRATWPARSPSSTRRSTSTRTARWPTTASPKFSSCRETISPRRTPTARRINGDGEPRWTEVWSHIQLGKIFDVTGQRERAINEYRQAIQTNDNTFGALEEARKYLAKAYERPKNKD